jgi:hypothetical protein
MKYQCNKGHIFTHPAKKTINHYNATMPDQKLPDGSHIFLGASEEFRTCPHCGNLNYEEYIEPQEIITSVKSVPLEECDNWIAKGYKVRELYAKTATMVLLEKPKAQETQQ